MNLAVAGRVKEHPIVRCVVDEAAQLRAVFIDADIHRRVGQNLDVHPACVHVVDALAMIPCRQRGSHPEADQMPLSVIPEHDFVRVVLLQFEKERVGKCVRMKINLRRSFLLVAMMIPPSGRCPALWVTPRGNSNPILPLTTIASAEHTSVPLR